MCLPLVIWQITILVHLVPHACQHITFDQSHSSGDTVSKIWKLASSAGTKSVSVRNIQKKNSNGINFLDWGDQCINASLFFL